MPPVNELERFEFAKNLIIEAGDLALQLCISIAYIRSNEVVLGIVNNPAAGELFISGVGRMAELNGQPIAPRTRVSDYLTENSLLLGGPIIAGAPQCLISSSWYFEGSLQPLRDEAGVGMDVYGLIPVWPSRELVWGVGGDHKDLPSVPSQFLRSDGECRPTAPDDEGFGVRMLVQPWPDTGLRRRLQDDGDAGVAW
jgi:hypothetical protein